MEELERQYAKQHTAYQDAATKQDPASVDAVKALSLQIADTLSRMIAILTGVKQESGNIGAYRDELVKKLIRIQHDYSGLLTNTDRLETLRRIRSYEESKFDSTFYWYMFAFTIIAVVLLIVLLFKKAPYVDASMMMRTSPIATPAFTYR